MIGFKWLLIVICPIPETFLSAKSAVATSVFACPHGSHEFDFTSVLIRKKTNTLASKLPQPEVDTRMRSQTLAVFTLNTSFVECIIFGWNPRVERETMQG